MTTAELAAEERCVEDRVRRDPAPDAWLGERLDAVRRELRRRGR
jgi:hypothetical protein